MTPIRFFAFLWLVSCGFSVTLLRGQTVFGPGYAPPELRVAPGQIVTVYVSGARSSLEAPLRAGGNGGVNVLGAFRVVLRQGPPEREVAVPLFAVQPYSNCRESAIACLERKVLGFTVQIPYEATPNVSTVPLPITSGGTTSILSIYENGEKLADQRLTAIQQDAIHILTGCDGANPFLPAGVDADARCWPVVGLPDGTLLRQGQNLRGGDVITLYAYGLGADDFQVTGQASPAAAENRTMDAQIDFGAGLAPRVERSRPVGGERNPAILYAGLSPGSIGLYQVNIRIPAVPAALPECVGDVTANLVITLFGRQSLDGVRLCVVR